MSSLAPICIKQEASRSVVQKLSEDGPENCHDLKRDQRHQTDQIESSGARDNQKDQRGAHPGNENLWDLRQYQVDMRRHLLQRGSRHRLHHFHVC